MSLAKITLYGMTRWMQESEDDLFANMDLPDGWDKDILVDTILLHGAEFEVLYANPDFMKNAIGAWSNKWYFTLERWLKALSIDYDPLENYDRREEWSEAGSRNKTESGTDSGTRQNAESRSNNSTTSTNTNSSTANSLYSKSEHDSTNEHQVSAFDASTYQPESKDILTGDDTVTNESTAASTSGNSQSTDAVNENVARSETDSRSRTDTESEQNASAHSGRIHGNIGTLTSQAMLQSELEIATFNMYEEAANLFLTELCIYVF